MFNPPHSEIIFRGYDRYNEWSYLVITDLYTNGNVDFVNDDYTIRIFSLSNLWK